MTRKEVSEKYDSSQDTLRYYERIGMIPPVTRTSSGIRDYQESDLGWVEHVICMRSAGLPVELSNTLNFFKRVTKPVRQDFSFWLSKEKIYSTKWNK